MLAIIECKYITNTVESTLKVIQIIKVNDNSTADNTDYNTLTARGEF